jgi:hypothetical protein
MLFAAICTDKPNAFEVRKTTRDAHLEYLKTLSGRLRLGGPFQSADGAIMNGSLLILEAESEAEARALLADDPYAKAGLFQSVDVRRWNWTVGAPE